MNTKQIIKKELINSFKHQLQRSLEVDIHGLEFLDLAEFANLVRERLVAADRRHTIRSKLSRKITKAQEKVQELICKILLVASDAQTVTGMLCIAITCGWQTCTEYSVANLHFRCSPNYCSNDTAKVFKSLSSTCDL